MMNLYELTGQESGIVIYGDGSVAVCNWSSLGAGEIPVFNDLLGMFGNNRGFKVVDKYEVSDILTQINGSIWLDDEEEKLRTDIDIVYDANNDMLTLFGFDENGNKTETKPTAGTVYELSDDIIIVAPYDWN